METWQLEHPRLGLIEVDKGFDWEFRELDPSWPKEPKKDKNGEIKRMQAAPADAGLIKRLKVLASNPFPRVQLRMNGKIAAQFDTLSDGRIPLRPHHMNGELLLGYGSADRDKPHLYIRKNTFGDITSIDYREGPTVVEFVPPPGSRGEKRREAMESSALKRVLFPLATGMGKGGWALAVIVLGPLIGRFIEWLLGFLPDFGWSLPSLPSISIPHIDLPVPALPQILLLAPVLPSIQLPELPAWVLFLAEYLKVWLPVLIGLVVGVMLLRNQKKSEQERKRWAEAADREAAAQDGATQSRIPAGVYPRSRLKSEVEASQRNTIEGESAAQGNTEERNP